MYGLTRSDSIRIMSVAGAYIMPVLHCLTKLLNGCRIGNGWSTSHYMSLQSLDGRYDVNLSPQFSTWVWLILD